MTALAFCVLMVRSVFSGEQRQLNLNQKYRKPGNIRILLKVGTLNEMWNLQWIPLFSF